MGNRPTLCIRCRKLIGLDDTCPYCGTDNSAIHNRLRRAFAGSGEGGPTVTQAIVTVNLFLYATALLIGGLGTGGSFDFLSPDIEVLFRLGLQHNEAIAHGQWWRLIMMVFLHLGLLHVAFNCYILHFAGQILEAEVGGRLAFLIYMGAGLAGSLGSYVADIGGAGASGAVFGVLGAILVRRRLIDGDFRHPLTRQLLYLLGINVVFGLAMASHINHVAHGAGFVAGCAIAWAVTHFRIRRAGAAALMLASGGMVVVTAAAFLFMAASLFTGSRHDFMETRACWMQVVDSTGPEFDPLGAEAARECLQRAHPLESQADEARRSALAGLSTAAEGYRAGDPGRVDDGVAQTRHALGQYTVWFGDAYARYGLERR